MRQNGKRLQVTGVLRMAVNMPQFKRFAYCSAPFHPLGWVGMGTGSNDRELSSIGTRGVDLVRPAGNIAIPRPCLREPAGDRAMGTGNFSRGTVAARRRAGVRFDADLGNRSFQLVEAGQAETLIRLPAALIGAGRGLAEPDSFNHTVSIPDDPLFGQLWGLLNTGAGSTAAAAAGADINAPGAWLRALGDPSIVVADLDSGYRFEHPDLAPVTWTNPGESPGTASTTTPMASSTSPRGRLHRSNGQVPSIDGDPTDDDLITGGHGVHTAGTIGAAGNNGVGVTGVAQNARLMPLRVCSRFPGSEDNRCLRLRRGRRRQLRRRQGRPHSQHVLQRHRREPGAGQRDGSGPQHAVRRCGRQRPQ